MEVVCVNCGASVKRARSQVRGRVFCSIECRKKFHRPMMTCLGCGAQFTRRPTNPARKYCSWGCFKRSRWQPVTCSECGKQFDKRISEIRKAEANGHRHMCSRACRNVSTSKLLGGLGEWVPGGKHGPARNRGPEWRAAKAFALKRDGYECQQCGDTNQLEVHHWEPWFVSFDNSPDNLVTLCSTCHRAKHEEYRREGFYEDLHR